MKILRIVSSGFEEGGVENGIVLMQPIFEEKGNTVKIMASDRRMDLARFDDYRFKAIDPNSITKFFYYAFNPYSYFLLKKILKEYKPDIVQLHTLGQVSPSVLFLLNKVPAVLTIHGPEAFTKNLLPWYLPLSDFKDKSYNKEQLTFVGKLHYFYNRYFLRTIYMWGIKKNIDVVVTLSNYMKRLMDSEGIKNIYVPNGAVLLDVRPLPHNKTFAYVGRLEKFKGVDYLLEAVATVVKNEPETQLVIAGEGSHRSELERQVQELQLTNNVVFKGHLSRAEVKALYENSIALVMPSTWPEAFGKVGIEAMSVGRPVIATDVGGVTDWLIDGENGYLVPPQDSGAIAKAMLNILENCNKLNELSSKARKKSEEFSLQRHVGLMISLYEKIINNKK